MTEAIADVLAAAKAALVDLSQFSKLAVELQTKIWESFDYDSREIEHNLAADFRGRMSYINKSRKPLQGPVLLRVCQASRYACLQVYRLYQSDTLIYVNPSIDTFAFASHEDFELYINRKKEEAVSAIPQHRPWPGATCLTATEILNHACYVLIHGSFTYPGTLPNYLKLKGLRQLTLRHYNVDLLCSTQVNLWEKWNEIWYLQSEETGVLPKLALCGMSLDVLKGKGGVVEYVEQSEEHLKKWLAVRKKHGSLDDESYESDYGTDAPDDDNAGSEWGDIGHG